ncbi:MAG TPA: hypothetical protein VGR94_00520 [Candidatus Acidoferrales bacterium]|nr:hypothetical protein [Candidatus Acidoferrales bacterium]
MASKFELPQITNPYTTELLVAHASKLSEKVQLLVSNNRQHITKTHRDTLALAYWTILFEYHHGILTLLRTGNPTSAFALLRVLEEAFLKLFLVMCGTDKQVQAIWEGTYNTDFAAVGAQIDEKLGKEPLFGPKLKGQSKPCMDSPTAALNNLCVSSPSGLTEARTSLRTMPTKTSASSCRKQCQ